MILSFTVENFLSFRDKHSIIFEATKDDSLEHSHVYCTKNHRYRVLKCAALYGANASGKSGLLEAMLLMRKMVLKFVSKNLEDTILPADPFALNSETLYAPTDFEIEFLIDEVRYRYGFSYTSEKIAEEWLYRKRPKVKEALLFSREDEKIKVNPTQFKEGQEFIQKTNTNVLFLRACAEWNAEIPKLIMNWFRNFRSVSGISEEGFYRFTAECLQDSDKRVKKLLRIAQKADFNISQLKSEIKILKEQNVNLPHSMPKELRRTILKNVDKRAEIKTLHQIFDNEEKHVGNIQFDLQAHESQGTCKFVALSGPIEHTLEEGSILIIDELEARLHPNLTKALLQWFMGPQNKKGGQLIFATHDTGLMVPELLRRDQVWFCDKDQFGASSLYCLDEFDSNKVRPTTRFDRQYLQGIFGAVPKVALNEL